MSMLRADDGAELYFEDQAGPDGSLPLLLLPGMLGSLSEQWSGHQGFLGRRRVLRMDLRGHGRSRDAAGALSIARLVRDVELLLEDRGIERCHLAGYSLGGYVGLQLELERPGRLASIAMLGTKFYWAPTSVDATLSQLQPDRIRAKVPAYASRLEAAHGPGWPLLLGRCAALVVDVAATGLGEPDLAACSCPVLVSVGDRDGLVPVAEAEALRRALPEGQLLVLPQTGHPFEQAPPELLEAAIERLMDRAESATR